MPPGVPPYFDGLIEGFRQGQVGRFVHLGFWDSPPTADALRRHGAFEQAQARLDDRLLALADLADGQRVLDVGCGFGGTLETIASRHRGMHLLGINIDRRQLEVCRSLHARPGNAFHWLQADACALPLADASVDRLLCIEAMFHFDSRRRFFAEAARVLAPGGMLVASDIVTQLPDEGPGLTGLAEAVSTGFGPWPDLHGRDADLSALAAAAGLQRRQWIDATQATLPSHVFTAPAGDTAIDPIGRASAALAALHRGGWLRYLLASFVRP